MYLTIFLSLLYSFSSYAFPNVGDSARYRLLVRVDGVTKFDGIMTKKLSAYDIENDRYFLESTNDGNIANNTYDVNPVEKKWVQSRDLSNDADLADTVHACGTANAPGELRFPKISGRRVAVCEQDMGENGLAQTGIVPFGYVFYQYHIKQNGHVFQVKQKMIEFKLGKNKSREKQ